jgi:hypothetical protein
MTGFMTGQQMLGYQPYQGPMPFQQQGALPGVANAGGMPGVGGAQSITGMQGVDSFSSMSGMGGMMPSMGSMGGSSMGQPQVSGSTLQLMAQINSMMASVMQGLMQFVQVLMQSVAQKQSQQTTETPTGTNQPGDTSTEGQKTDGTSNPQPTNGPPGEVKSGDAEAAIKFFMGKGWSRAQAAGIVANLKHESGLRTDAVGDGGQAYGVAQWHPDRQANYTKFAKANGLQHSNIREATFAEQLAFVHYELTEGNEKSAGSKIKATTDAGGAAAAFCRYYERPADPDGQSAKRAASANELA